MKKAHIIFKNQTVITIKKLFSQFFHQSSHFKEHDFSNKRTDFFIISNNKRKDYIFNIYRVPL